MPRVPCLSSSRHLGARGHQQLLREGDPELPLSELGSAEFPAGMVAQCRVFARLWPKACLESKCARHTDLTVTQQVITPGYLVCSAQKRHKVLGSAHAAAPRLGLGSLDGASPVLQGALTGTGGALRSFQPKTFCDSLK